jgi:hypothetical protein
MLERDSPVMLITSGSLIILSLELALVVICTPLEFSLEPR